MKKNWKAYHNVKTEKAPLRKQRGFFCDWRPQGDRPTTSVASRALLRRLPSARWRGHPWPLFWH